MWVNWINESQPWSRTGVWLSLPSTLTWLSWWMNLWAFVSPKKPCCYTAASWCMRQQQTVSNNGNKPGKQCLKCGFTLRVDMWCPAWGKKNFNHFSRMCNVYDVQTMIPINQVIYCFDCSRSDWSIELAFGINLVKFKLRVDTGADVNVLPRKYPS